jgi:hypothetical protein
MTIIKEDFQFPHRKNKRSSFDSICPRCFRTISTRWTEEELKQDENDHLCEQDSLGSREPVKRVHDEALREGQG